MRLAVFSDVHGNLAALEAVLQDIKRRSTDYTVCAGDLVGYGPFPNQVIELITSGEIPSVMGNYDDGVGFSRMVCGCDYPDPEAQRSGERSITWTKEQTTIENKKVLAGLPREIRLETKGKQLLVVHGSPRQLNEYLRPDTPEVYFRELLAEEAIDVLICGHTHVPFLKRLDRGLIVNVGSVGRPKHGRPNAVYALIHVEQEVSVDFIEVPYPVEITARAIEASSLPNEFARQLRTGC